MVFAASSSAYGETPTLPKVETMSPAPISPYGVTKFVGELYAQTFGRCYALKMSLSATSTFSALADPGSRYSGVLAKFCLYFLEETQPVIFGDGEQSATSPTSKTPCRPISSLAKRPPFLERLSTWEPAAVLLEPDAAAPCKNFWQEARSEV